MNKKAFSFLELMVVIIVMGMLAVFVMPNYEHMQARTREKIAAKNLDIIIEAVKLLHAKEGGSYVTLSDIYDINDTLSLEIIPESNVAYECGYGLSPMNDGSAYYCLANDTKTDDWVLYIDYTNNKNNPIPVCWMSAPYDNCPSCTAAGCMWD